MAHDPLRIRGQPAPSPEERARSEALAAETGRPAKMCRAALIDAGQDVVKARSLLADEQFCRMHTDFDLGKMFKLASSDPSGMMAYMLDQQQLQGAIEPEAADKAMAAFESIRPELERQEREADAEERRERKRRGKTLEDPVFGLLKYDTYAWTRDVEVPGFGRMSLLLNADFDHPEAPPTESQRNAFQEFMKVASRLHAEAADESLRYYGLVRDQYLEAFGEEDVPEIKSPEEMWEHLDDPAISIDPERTEQWRVVLSWHCPWDMEHGHAVYVQGGHIVHVGIQGESFDSLPA